MSPNLTDGGIFCDNVKKLVVLCAKLMFSLNTKATWHLWQYSLGIVNSYRDIQQNKPVWTRNGYNKSRMPSPDSTDLLTISQFDKGRLG